MNAAARLLLTFAALYIGAQVIRWEPALAIPLGAVAVATIFGWILAGHRAAVGEYDTRRDRQEVDR